MYITKTGACDRHVPDVMFKRVFRQNVTKEKLFMTYARPALSRELRRRYFVHRRNLNIPRSWRENTGRGTAVSNNRTRGNRLPTNEY